MIDAKARLALVLPCEICRQFMAGRNYQIVLAGPLVPESDICTAANCSLFDHLVGEDVELRRNGQAELVGSRAVEAARWHCVRYVMAITKKRFSLPNCAKRTAHS